MPKSSKSAPASQASSSGFSTLAAIRSGFLDYFARHGHTVMESSGLVPQNDPTLLFTNAGMVQFKNVFTGAEPARSSRVATSQKCVRAGGKHNDLDNVGYTARHHTFFEMLGNFSFGDYFKEEAIARAWELVTGDFALAKQRLTVTVYADDEEAASLWRKIAGLPDSRIIRIATSDNFWSMGDTGPCGPCSEIFFDHGEKIWGGPPGSADADGDRFIEIWNLVFMQFDQSADGTRTSLPKPSIDTGMGLERIAAVLQGKHNNYDVDLFQTVIGAAEERLSRRAEGEALGSFRVIADHLRAMSFLIADGVSPSNEGRGYVLRRIMRRAMRHAHILGAREPVLADLVPVLAAEMGAAYPALVAATPYIAATVAGEEERFQRTLGRGLEHLEDAVKGLGEGGALDGEIAFRLYDTYGFPLDLTQDVLRGRGLGVDTDGFNVAMERQREQARATWQGSGDARTEEVWLTLGQTVGASAFLGYTALEGAGQIVALLRDGVEVDALEAGDTGAVVLDQTPAYAESGGQAGDHGVLSAGTAQFHFADTQKRAGGLHVHVGTLTGGALRKGDRVDVEVNAVRRARLRSNHSATHLLHAALRRHLGPHVAQKGSLVEADRLRFDFTHGKPLTAAEIEAIEAEVNAVIRQNAAAVTEVMSPDAAVAAGAVALFGEKYGEQVRVLRLGDDPTATDRPYSVELCGGTHVARTGDIAVFTLLSETGVSAGVRRVEATTGADALAYLKAQADLARSVAELLKAPVGDVPARVEALLEQRRKLEASLADAKRKAALGGAGPVNDVETVGTVQAILRVAEGVAARDIRNLIDEAKTRVGSGVVAFVAVNEGKATLAVGVTPDLTARISAVDLVKVGAEPVGGKGGGGRPDMAQAGGPNGDQAEAALAAIRTALAAI